MTTICASKIDWRNGYGNANNTEIFGRYTPLSEFVLQSPKTGVTKAFRVDLEEAERSEFWDGEFTIYRSDDKKHSVRIWNY